MHGKRLGPPENHPRYSYWKLAYRNADAAREPYAALQDQLPEDDPMLVEVGAIASAAEAAFEALCAEIS
jgi:hypothetical protein